MKKLILCDTYYQLLVAVQLKLTLFKNDQVSVWISDHSNGAERVAKQLKKIDCFENVKFIRTKNFIYQRSKVESIKDIIQYNFGLSKINKLEQYDEIIFYNLTLIVYAIQDYYTMIGHSVIWSRMEEGLFSYETDLETGLRVQATRAIRKIVLRKDVASLIQNYYCFFPQLKKSHPEWTRIQIPRLEASFNDLRRILNFIFEYVPQDFPQKYIFLASSSDIDGHSYGETELVQQIAREVGNQNLLVKMHPRDTRRVYQDLGIPVMENYNVPWEVVQLNWNEPKKLLTVNSGAFISICALQNENVMGYFLYPSVKTENIAFQKRRTEMSIMLSRLHSEKIALNISETSIEQLLQN